MKKLLIGLFSGLVIIIFVSGCSFSSNYMKRHSKELHVVFGDYDYEYLGKDRTAGYEGIGGSDYWKYRLTFTDSYGNKESVIIRDDRDIDNQIFVAYRYYIQRALVKNLLKDYVKYYFEYDDIGYLGSSDFYYTKDEKYRIMFDILIDTSEIYNNKLDKIYDYSAFNMTNLDIEELIKQGKVTIQNIKFDPNSKEILGTMDLANEIDTLRQTASSMNKIIPIENVKYFVNVEKTDFKGEPYKTTEEHEIYIY